MILSARFNGFSGAFAARGTLNLIRPGLVSVLQDPLDYPQAMAVLRPKLHQGQSAVSVLKNVLPNSWRDADDRSFGTR